MGINFVTENMTMAKLMIIDSVHGACIRNEMDFRAEYIMRSDTVHTNMEWRWLPIWYALRHAREMAGPPMSNNSLIGQSIGLNKLVGSCVVEVGSNNTLLLILLTHTQYPYNYVDKIRTAYRPGMSGYTILLIYQLNSAFFHFFVQMYIYKLIL